MGEKQIREKYGGKLAKAINRAIRTEIPEGNQALDRLAKLSGPAAHSGWTHPDGSLTDEAKLYHKHKKEVVDPLEKQIRLKWGLPYAPDSEPGGKRPAKKRQSGSKKKPQRRK